IRYILVKIANRYQNETNIALDFNKVHIEHIMPENNSKWEVSEKDHTDYLWRLGNLTLLGANFNKRNSNKKFSEKKKGYSDSDINLTKKLLAYDDWGVKQIQLRQEELTTMALSIWTK
ncbi:MAG: HNH endonuclease family protein, partial [Desulfovibrio sp.]